MNTNNKHAFNFIKSLIDLDIVQELEKYDDQGVKVTTHTYDVLKISIKELEREFKTLEDANNYVDFFALTVGIIIHDLSKGSIRKNEEQISHSQMMLKKPEYIIKEVDRVLNLIERNLNLRIRKNIRKNIIHIVLSHHGKWGKIQPNTKEAHIVHKADMYSAKYHRINPIGADTILKLIIKQGVKFEELPKRLNCTKGIIKDRIKRSKAALNLKTTKQLINYYIKNKKIPIGDDFFIKRVRETQRLMNIVEKKGFSSLILDSPLIIYMNDEEIFVMGEGNES